MKRRKKHSHTFTVCLPISAWVAYCECGWNTGRCLTDRSALVALREHLEQTGASESAPTNVPEAANRTLGPMKMSPGRQAVIERALADDVLP